MKRFIITSLCLLTTSFIQVDGTDVQVDETNLISITGLSTTTGYSTMSTDELKDALMKSVRTNDVDSVSQILDQPEAKRFSKITLRKALELAAKNDFIKIVHALIQAGAKDDYAHALENAAEKGYLEIAKVLLTVPGTNKDYYTNSFYNAFIKAAENGHLAVVEEFIKAGANVNFMNVWGDRALVLAAKNGHANVVKRLIQAGAKVNDFNSNGETALHWAVRLNHVDVAKELLQVRGIDLNRFAKSTAQDQGGEMQKLFQQFIH